MGRPEASSSFTARSPPDVQQQQPQDESNQQFPNGPTHQPALSESSQSPNFPPQANTTMPQQVVHPAAGAGRLSQSLSGNFAPQPMLYAAHGYHQPLPGYAPAPPLNQQYVPGGYAMAGAPPLRNPPAVPMSLWQTGLFDCFDDPLNAIITWCLPCYTFGQIAEILDQGNTSCAMSALIYGLVVCLIGCPCFLSCSYRTKLRSKYNLIETPAPDWLTHCLCEHCALCQEYRELQKRGIDPAIGWHANVARNQQVTGYQVAMIPPMHQNMRG